MEERSSVELEMIESNLPFSSSDSSYVEEMGEKSSKLDWILKTGLNIGKKFVISGMLMSSVPLVLPPLVVISALGIASSVPFGFVCASYACTQELMSKLLPGPPLSHQLIDYEELMPLADEEDQESVAIGQEEHMRMEDKLIDTDEFQQTSVEQYEAAATGGSEAGGELMKTDDSATRTKDKEQSAEDRRSMRSLQEEFGVEDAKGTTSSMCTIEIHKDAPILEKPGQKYTAKDVKGKKHFSGDRNAKDQEVKIKIAEDTTSKGNSSSTDLERKGKKKTLKSSSKKKGPKAEKMHEGDKLLVENEAASGNNLNRGLVRKGELGDVGKQLHPEVVAEERGNNDRNSFTRVKEHTGTEELSSPLERGDRDNSQIIIASEKLETGKKLSLNGNSEVGDVLQGQRPFDVGVVSNIHHELASETTHNVLAGGREDYRQPDELKQDETGEHVPGMAPSTRKSDLNQDEKAGEGLSTDEKIWREIEAIRLIVGSKAPRLPSCLEELRALYLFTGIDPPSLFGDPSDIGEVYSKLRFLKSVIGVK